MQLGYRGSVNRWECDENDHLNVRFYVEKHWQTLLGGLRRLGILDDDAHVVARAALEVQHLRFLAESRLSAPLSGYCAVVAQRANQLTVLTQLRHALTQQVLCNCVHRLAGLPGEVTDEIPLDAAGRGIADIDLNYAALAMHELEGYGFQTIGAGVISPDECDPQGCLLVHHYMSRLSDSMPHLWGAAEIEEGNTTEGGAVLEYRLRYLHPLKCSNRFVVNSGILQVTPKVQQFAHLVFNAETGQICISAQAVVVRMDLIAPKAKVLSTQQISRLNKLLIKPMS